jgi:hypothetical protein
MEKTAYVYYMTNKSYTDKCKIGFTTKIPQEIANEL